MLPEAALSCAQNTPAVNTSRLRLICSAALLLFFCGALARAQTSLPNGAPGTTQGIDKPAITHEASATLAGATNIPEMLKPVWTKPEQEPDSTSEAKEDAAHQRISIHGHWVIDVSNPDGKLVEHREFENALQYDGMQLILSLLSGYAVAGNYEIYFTAPTGGTSPCTSGQYPFCAIVQSTTAQPGVFACSIYYCVTGLTETYTFGVGPSMKLLGTMTAPGAGTIGSVGTGYNACGNSGSGATLTTISPVTCSTATGGAYGGTMTYASVSPAVSVVAGQIIQISITITFS